MDVSPLLERLGVDAELRPDPPTLQRLHRAWRTRVPYEIPAADLGRDGIGALWERSGTQYAAWREITARATR